MPELALQLERPLVVLDIEATGTSPVTDRIIDLALIRIAPDGTRTEQEYRLNPERPIPPDATKVHGIRDEDVRNCPAFRDRASVILDALSGCDLAGFNLLRFDIPMLVEEFHRVGIVFAPAASRVVDAQRIFHRREPRDLTAAVQFYCQELHLGAHGAMADAEATLRVIEAQLRRYADLPRDVPGLDTYCNPRDPSWVDRDGRLRWAGDDIVLNFGKKKGTSLRALVQDDPGFIKWMLRSDFSRDVKDLLENALRGEWPTPPA